ncbi:IS110 family transposase [Actinokineospora sp. HUAS TT18]|uniref:IS110 family transposase n=1 Tax=Actinokineospora sp. HUAS TT18 TaxID=3447451 RepID=UPI003F5202F8
MPVSAALVIGIDPHKASWTAVAVEVLDVPAKLGHRVRMLSTGHGRKTDEADALSVGIAALGSDRLTTAHIDEQIAALRALTEHRDDLIRTRTQTATACTACSPNSSQQAYHAGSPPTREPTSHAGCAHATF